MSLKFATRYALVDEDTYKRLMTKKPDETGSKDPLTNTKVGEKALSKSASALRAIIDDPFFDETQKALALSQVMRAYTKDYEEARFEANPIARPTTTPKSGKRSMLPYPNQQQQQQQQQQRRQPTSAGRRMSQSPSPERLQRKQRASSEDRPDYYGDTSTTTNKSRRYQSGRERQHSSRVPPPRLRSRGYVDPETGRIITTRAPSAHSLPKKRVDGLVAPRDRSRPIERVKVRSKATKRPTWATMS